jgi:hypothetical protein
MLKNFEVFEWGRILSWRRRDIDAIAKITHYGLGFYPRQKDFSL